MSITPEERAELRRFCEEATPALWVRITRLLDEVERLEGDRAPSGETWKEAAARLSREAAERERERDEARAEVAKLMTELETQAQLDNLQSDNAALRAEMERLEERHEAHLRLIRNLSQSSISPAEADEMRGQIAVLIAEVGTLRNRVQETER